MSIRWGRRLAAHRIVAAIGKHSLRLRIPLITLALALPAVASGGPVQLEQSRTALIDRAETGRKLLDEGVDGLAAVLADVGAPSLTFDQEAQVRLLHETYDRQRIRLLEDFEGANFEQIERDLAAQLLLAAAKFLNPVQRDALGGFLDAEINADLPQDEGELREYLRDLTNPISGQDGFTIDGFSGGRMPNRDEILEIRINDNAFTAEQSNQGRGRTQVITRGGTGNFNGDVTFDFADESLDARNAFAAFRAPYQTRNWEVNLSAPLIRNRLTLTGSLENTTDEEGDTIRALTPSGLITDAITRPEVGRAYTTRATTQLNDDHALTFSFTYGSGKSEGRGVGGFGLPEQGSMREESDFNFQVQETAVLSPTLNNEVRFRWNRQKEETVPLTNAPHINVRDAFRGGGSTDRELVDETSLEFSEFLMYTGGDLSIKAGFDGQFEREYSESYEDFNGTFTFSDLESYVAGEPIRYSVNQGDPVLETSQFQTAAFFQSDFRLTPRLTMGLGLRYEAQSILDDRNNLDPRFGFAYQIGGTTVLRGGSGIFHDRIGLWIFEDVIRFDGERQQTLIIRNPSYPDPFQGGEQTLDIPSSIHVQAEDLAAPYSWNSEMSVETTLPFGLGVTGAYRFIRGIHLLRGRNLNAPLDITSLMPRSCSPEQDETICVRPFPDEGDIVQLESTGTSRDHEFRLGFQQRMSFVNVRGNYRWQSTYSDTSGDGFDLPADNYNLALEWGPTDPTHTIDASVNLRLPWNVDADMQFDWSSGDPYSLETGFDDNQDSNTNDRPSGVPRNSLVGPSFFDMGLALSKTFILIPETEGRLDPAAGGGYFGRRSGVRMTIEARAENVLNRMNVSRVSGVQTSPFFGLPIRARDARQVALSMRFDF